MSPNPRAEQLMAELDMATRLDVSERKSESGRPLDDRTRALVVIGAALCSNSPTNRLRSFVETAKTAGATEEDILGVLLAVAPAAGESRLVTVVPRISKALGYDVDRALE